MDLTEVKMLGKERKSSICPEYCCYKISFILTQEKSWLHQQRAVCNLGKHEQNYECQNKKIVFSLWLILMLRSAISVASNHSLQWRHYIVVLDKMFFSFWVEKSDDQIVQCFSHHDRNESLFQLEIRRFNLYWHKIGHSWYFNSDKSNKKKIDDKANYIVVLIISDKALLLGEYWQLFTKSHVFRTTLRIFLLVITIILIYCVIQRNFSCSSCLCFWIWFIGIKVHFCHSLLLLVVN